MTKKVDFRDEKYTSTKKKKKKMRRRKWENLQWEFAIARGRGEAWRTKKCGRR